MLPRATVRDDRPLATVRSWWRSRTLPAFVVVHCAIAGALQLGALLTDLARAGRPLPGAPTLFWAWLGLALIASMPALVTILVARRFRRVLAIGIAFYFLPVLLLVGSVRPLMMFVPVAVLFHTVLAWAPAPRR